ncbi:adenylosuccinate lyase, partial [Candidatus Azambacteria bacterium]|nr:adenylosuccinate lyase [Candidatus Azambacteria bacterium]
MLESLSPIDGRYEKKSLPLAAYFSEKALMKYRLIIEGEYLMALSETKGISLRKFTQEEKSLIRGLYDLDLVGANKIKEFEAVTNHDVKAVEYFLKEKLKKTSLKDSLEWIHFALTSEDINNL